MKAVINLLKDFGLTDKEAGAYFILSKLGPATAREVSQALNYNRLQTYRSLKELMNKGLIEVSLDRPRRYIPVNVEKAISLLEQEAKNKVLELEKKKPLLLREWAGIPDFRIVETTYSFRVIQGSKNVFRLGVALCESAEREIYSAIGKEGLLRSVNVGFDDILEKCARRGVTVRRLSEIYRDNIDAAKRFLQFSDLRHASSHGLAQYTIVDDREVLIGLSGYPEKPENDNSGAIWTNHPDFVKMMKAFFDKTWETAEDGRRRIKEIETGKLT